MTKSDKEDSVATVTNVTNDKEPTRLTEDINIDGGDIKNEFNVKIVKETNNSITLEWNLIPETDVYEIEVHHKVKGWKNLDW